MNCQPINDILPQDRLLCSHTSTTEKQVFGNFTWPNLGEGPLRTHPQLHAYSEV